MNFKKINVQFLIKLRFSLAFFNKNLTGRSTLKNKY